MLGNHWHNQVVRCLRFYSGPKVPACLQKYSPLVDRCNFDKWCGYIKRSSHISYSDYRCLYSS